MTSSIYKPANTGCVNSPFIKTTYILTFLCLPLWSNFLTLSEMLSSGLQSSFCLQQNSTGNSQVMRFFFSPMSAGMFTGGGGCRVGEDSQEGRE